MQETADLVKITENILNGKIHFLCSINSGPEINIKARKVSHVTAMNN